MKRCGATTKRNILLFYCLCSLSHRHSVEAVVAVVPDVVVGAVVRRVVDPDQAAVGVSGAVLSVVVNLHQAVEHRIHHQAVDRIRNKPTILVVDHIPTLTMDGIQAEISTIRMPDMVITIIHHRLRQIGDLRTTVRLTISNHKMHSEHFIQLAVVKIIIYNVVISFPSRALPSLKLAFACCSSADTFK